MLQQCFQNIFITGSIISICILPLLIYLSKYKSKYNPKNIYTIFLIISIILFLPILNLKFKIKNYIVKNEFDYSYNIEEPSFIQNSNIDIGQTEITYNNFNDILNQKIEIKNNTIFKVYSYIPSIWAIISVTMFFYYLIVYKIYIHKLKINIIKNQEIEDLIDNIKSNFNVKRKINYAFSSNITTPISIGILNKKIIIPEIFDNKDFEYILKHEIFHVKNKDIEYKFMVLILNCIYWFNPIVYFLINQIEQMVELNCDYSILEKENMNYRIKYGNVLLNQIEKNRKTKYKLVMNFSSSRRNIMDRFSNIVNESVKKKSVMIGLILIVLIIISLLLMLFTPNVNIATTDEEKTFEIFETLGDTENIDNEIEMENSFDDIKSVENTEDKKDIQEKENKPVSNTSNSLGIDFIEPVSGTITSRFDQTSKRNHTGLDIFAHIGTDIKAAASGTVIYSQYKGAYGNLVIIQHNDLVQTYYASCSELIVNVGDTVEQGDVIAKVGSTGNSTGPHLHFEVRVDNKNVNPQLYTYIE